jgi:hypothetical protein
MNFSDERSAYVLRPVNTASQTNCPDGPFLAVSQAIHPHQRIGNPTYGPAFSLAHHRHVEKWQCQPPGSCNTAGKADAMGHGRRNTRRCLENDPRYQQPLNT